MHFNLCHYQFRNIHTINGLVNQSELTIKKRVKTAAFVNKSINAELFTINAGEDNLNQYGPLIMGAFSRIMID